MGNAYSDIAALCLSGLTLYVFYSRGRISARQTRLFSFLLYATITASFASILRLAVYYAASPSSTELHSLVTTIYFSIMSALPLILSFFILNLAEVNLSGRPRLCTLFVFPWAVLCLVIISTPWTEIMFSFSAAGTYSRGSGYPLLYALSIYYAAFILYFLVKFKHKFSLQIRKSVYLFLPFSLLPALIHLANPALRLHTLGMAFSELIMLMTFLDSSPMIDEESNLLNRDGFLQQMELFRMRNESFSAILIYIDTIDFIRHGLGSEAFAKLLAELCMSLFGFPRDDRFAARIGPGSFIHILSGEKRIRKQLERLNGIFASPWKINGTDIRLSARICVIRFPEDTGDTDTILRSMFRLSRRWQQHPAQTVLSFSELMDAEPGRYLEVQNAIRRGFLNKSFELFYQPIVCAATGKTVSAEALIRLQDTTLGWISPAEFIPAAEQSGSIHRIGDWVIETACEFLARLDAEGAALHDLEINLSSMQCVQSNIAQKVRSITMRRGIDPARLCLEITETAAGYSKNQLKKNMEALSQAGYPIAIDDFGTGFANLANLLSINFDRIKLDKSLIDTLAGEGSRAIGLESLTALFKSLGTTIIAEGVETEEQAERVKALEIDLIQGYYYSRPLAEDDFIAYIRKGERQCT